MATVGKTSEVPIPETASATPNSAKPMWGWATAATQARPTAWSSRPTTMNGRLPHRSASRPAIGETMTGAAVQASSRSPACRGLRCWADWKNCDIRKTAPNSPAYRKKLTPLAELKRGRRNISSESIGVRVRRSQRRKSPTSTAPASSEPITSPLAQPALFARTSPQVSPKNPAPASSSPGTSRRGRGPWLSFSFQAQSGISARPIGTFSQKIQCQLIPWTTAPPTTGPAATASPAMPPHIPMAMPRFSLGNASLISVSVSGITIAAPAPCTARAAISAPTVGASAAPADAAVKTARPTQNIRRRPNRSPSAAAVSSEQAKQRL